MTRDANQIAQEAARRENLGSLLQPPRPEPLPVRMPTRGTFTVWQSLQALNSSADPLDKFKDVIVDVSKTGVIIMISEEGSKYLLYPQPGWYCEFIPNDDARE